MFIWKSSVFTCIFQLLVFLKIYFFKRKLGLLICSQLLVIATQIVWSSKVLKLAEDVMYVVSAPGSQAAWQLDPPANFSHYPELLCRLSSYQTLPSVVWSWCRSLCLVTGGGLCSQQGEISSKKKIYPQIDIMLTAALSICKFIYSSWLFFFISCLECSQSNSQILS